MGVQGSLVLANLNVITRNRMTVSLPTCSVFIPVSHLYFAKSFLLNLESKGSEENQLLSAKMPHFRRLRRLTNRRSSTPNSQRPSFLTLPAEIREEIYALLFVSDQPIVNPNAGHLPNYQLTHNSPQTPQPFYIPLLGMDFPKSFDVRSLSGQVPDLLALVGKYTTNWTSVNCTQTTNSFSLAWMLREISSTVLH
jgi:hypothetical protein